MRILIHVKPKSKVERVAKSASGDFVVCVNEPAEGGRANEAAIKALATHFEVSRSRIRIIKGFRGHRKIVEII